MIGALEALRSATLDVIKVNPDVIAIERVIYSPTADGGRSLEPQMLPPFSGRLLPVKRLSGWKMDEASLVHQSSMVLIAPPAPRLKAGDAFSLDGQRYVVGNVIVREFHGSAYAQHADITKEIGS